jgi:hypothetical protein
MAKVSNNAKHFIVQTLGKGCIKGSVVFVVVLDALLLLLVNLFDSAIDYLLT